MIPKKHDLLIRKTVIAGTLAALATPCLAQMTLEEVVVTAQKREQTVQDIPAAVAAISEEALELTNTKEFSDLNKIASGVTITGGADGFGAIIRIRGIGNNSFAPAIRPSVGIFLNEVPLGSLESAYNNLADVERIEILKGPQSTLFGKEVSSGAISIFTKRPDTTGTEGYVEGNIGNLGLQEYKLGGNVPLGDMFAVRASYYNSERDGTVRNLADIPGIGRGNGDMGEYDKDGYRIRLGFEPTDRFSAVLSYEDHDINVYGSTSVAQQYGDLYTTWNNNVVDNPQPGDLDILDPFDRVTSHSAPTDRDTRTRIWSLNIQWDLSDQWSLTSVTSDQDYGGQIVGIDGSGRVNADGQRVPATADTSVGPYKINDFYQDQGTDTFTQELRFSYDSDKWSSIIGVFYAETETFNYVPFTGALGALPSGNVFTAGGLSDLDEDIDEWAVFNHNIWSIREGLDFTFGVRYSETDKEALKAQLTGVGPLGDLNTPPVPVTPWADNVPKQKESWDSVTGTLKLTWWLSDEVSIYGGWDRGFKAGGFNVCKGTGAEPEGCGPEDSFDDESADNFEIGIKGRFLDNTLVWNTSVFQQRYDDFQVEIQDEEGIGNTIQNAAKVKVEGIETDFQWLVSDRLLLDGNISYVDSRWDEYEDAGCLRPQYQAVACDPVTLTQDLSGKRLNYTSPWTANLNVTWDDNFSNGMGWFIRGEYAYRDDRFFFPDLDPDLTDEDYFLLNASLGIRAADGTWDVTLWGKNLTDEEYLISASRNRDAGNAGFGTVPIEGYRVTAGDERTYGLTLRYRFGGA